MLVAIFGNSLHAQGVKRDSVPGFRIALTDSSYFKKSDLKREVPVMLIYFSPDCEHCNNFFREIISDYEKFKKIQIVMISNHAIPELKEFENRYQVRKYRNIKIGTEGRTFQIQRYYQITRFPFVALFDGNGGSIAVYRDIPPIGTICQALKL